MARSIRLAPVGLLVAGIMLTLSAAFWQANPANASTQVIWTGNGSENLPCADGAHWILSPAQGITSATLNVNGVQYVMTQSGQGAYSADSSGALDQGSSASAVYEGENDKAFLKLSHCVEGEETPTPTQTRTPTDTPTSTPTSTNTPSPTPTKTLTPTPPATPTGTQTPTSTLTASPTPTSTPTGTLTPTSTNTPSPTPTEAQTPTSTPTSTQPTSTPTERPTLTGTVTPPKATPSKTVIPPTPIPPKTGAGIAQDNRSDTWFILVIALALMGGGVTVAAAIRRR